VAEMDRLRFLTSRGLFGLARVTEDRAEDGWAAIDAAIPHSDGDAAVATIRWSVNGEPVDYPLRE
jgi:hypothetical protein